jgi:hypothetical protein
MSTDRDVTRIVRSWLKEDAHEDPQRVLDGVRDQLDANRQSRARWLARRFPAMNNAIRILVPAAAVVVVALVGIRLISPGTSGGAVATPSPTPIAMPSAAVTPSPSPAVRPLPVLGEAAPGRYTIKVPTAPLTVALTIGSGWSSGSDFIAHDYVDRVGDAVVNFYTVGNVYEDICDAHGGGVATASLLPDPRIGPTVDDLVSALDAQVNTDMSPAVDVVVGGHAGKRVTMIVSDPYEHCITDPPRPYFIDPSGEPVRYLQPGEPDTLWIVDVDGQRLVIITVEPEGSTLATDVVSSIEFVAP